MKNLIGVLIIIILGILLSVGLVLAAEDIAPKGLVPANCLGDAANCGLCDFIQVFILGADIIVGLSGTAALIMFIWGGIAMLTAYGNPGRFDWGKNILIAAVVGILFVFLAWTFINLTLIALYGGQESSVFNQITGHTSLNQWGVCANPPAPSQ